MTALPNRTDTSPDYCDVVVMGAGPYGLSTATHLRQRGLEVAVFGRPLELWRKHMPKGMLLRSYWWATNLSDPGNRYGLEQYFKAVGEKPSHPFPIERFIDYALWFQEHAEPLVDETYVRSIERRNGHFRVSLEDGRRVEARAVVMAPGLQYYVYRPPEYEHLPRRLFTHASEHASYEEFAGRHVAVIGGGQSALETAALLNEVGAQVEVVARRPIVWLSGDSMENRTLLSRLRRPKAGIAPGWLNWGLEAWPYLFQRLPRSVKDRLLDGRMSYGPAGAHWLKERILGSVSLHERQRVAEIQASEHEVTLILSNGSALKVERVILGTGYRVDVSKLPMLHPTLLSSLKTYRGAPILSNHFETNVPGLYFVGFSAVVSCGPLFRFVVGTDAAARRVAASITSAPLRRPRPVIDSFPSHADHRESVDSDVERAV